MQAASQRDQGEKIYASRKATFSQIAGRHLVAIALFGYISMVPFEQFKYMNIGINNQNLVQSLKTWASS